jgi:paraquat-inducible protein A
MRLAVPLMLFAASLCLALGLVLPLIRLERLYVFTQEPSLIEIISGLWSENEWLLALVVGLFSVVFPIVKLGILHVLSYGAAHERPAIPAWLKTLSNWSMLDVVAGRAGDLRRQDERASPRPSRKPGLWFFAGSAVLTVALRPTCWNDRAGVQPPAGPQWRYCWMRVVRRPARPYSSIDACQERNSSVVSL